MVLVYYAASGPHPPLLSALRQGEGERIGTWSSKSLSMRERDKELEVEGRNRKFLNYGYLSFSR